MVLKGAGKAGQQHKVTLPYRVEAIVFGRGVEHVLGAVAGLGADPVLQLELGRMFLWKCFSVSYFLFLFILYVVSFAACVDVVRGTHGYAVA